MKRYKVTLTYEAIFEAEDRFKAKEKAVDEMDVDFSMDNMSVEEVE